VQQLKPPPLAETLSRVWFDFHSNERFGVRSSEVHYFTSLAVALDDDLSSLLLLKKLKLARQYACAQMPGNIIGLNSDFEFTTGDGESRIGQLVHSSAHRPGFAIPSNSRLGIGLLGLKTGQRILWPGDDGMFRTIEVLDVGQRFAAENRSASS
jgi:hypothetical protein